MMFAKVLFCLIALSTTILSSPIETCLTCPINFVSPCWGKQCEEGYNCKMTKPDNCFTCPKPECRPISECPMCKIAGCDAIRCGNDTVCKIITPENCFNHCPIAECVKLSQLGDDCGNYSDVKKICDTGLTCKLTDISLPEIGGVCVKEECVVCSLEAPSCAAVTCLSGSVCEITQKTCVSCPEARCSLPKECVACDMMIPTCDAVDCAEGYQCSVVPPKDCTECAIAQCVPTF